MKILESYKKMAKSMLIEHAWDRKFGEPLPTIEDVMAEAEMSLKSKGLGKGDFERDFDDSEPEDKPHGGDTGKDADSHQSAISSFVDDYKETEEHEGESAAMDSIDDNIDDYITGTLKIKRDTSEYEEEFDKMHDEVQKQISGGKKEETIIINGKKYRPIKEKK